MVLNLSSSVCVLLAATAGLFAGSASGHGHVKTHLMNGVSYIGYLPISNPDFTADAPSIVRKIPGDGPIKTPLLANITCNEGAVPIAGRTGAVTAGTPIKFYWNEWPHQGPIFTYMAKCNPDCGSFTGTSGPVWFKIDEMGYNNVTNTWATQKLFDDGNTWSSVIPSCLAPGDYLVRHEIIALSDAYKTGGCQFYPSCAQVTVLGSGTVNPTGYALPGFYDPAHPGIKFNTNLPYTYYPMPGPALFKCPA